MTASVRAARDGVLLVDLGAPLERLEQRRQRARIAHLEQQRHDELAVARVLGMLDVGLHELVDRSVGELLDGLGGAIALLLGQHLAVEAREVAERVLASHRIGELASLARRIVGIRVARRQAERYPKTIANATGRNLCTRFAIARPSPSGRLVPRSRAVIFRRVYEGLRRPGRTIPAAETGSQRTFSHGRTAQHTAALVAALRPRSLELPARSELEGVRDA